METNEIVSYSFCLFSVLSLKTSSLFNLHDTYFEKSLNLFFYMEMTAVTR